MALRDPFALRVATIQAFLDVPPTRVLELVRPPDLELLVGRLLARLADEPSDPHAWLYLSIGFDGYREFLGEVMSAVDQSVGAAAADIAEAGLTIPHPPELDPGDEPWPWTQQVAEYMSRVAEAMPPDAGALVLVLEMPDVAHTDAVGWLLGGFALATASDRVKIIAVHSGGRWTPDSPELADHVLEVDFAVDPAEIEREVLSDLESGSLDAGEARRYQLLAGAFASSNGRFDEAAARLSRSAADAGEVGQDGERANALYNLGNVYSRAERHEDASEALAEAAQGALDSGNHGLGAMCLTNLGISLYHEGRGQEAVQSLAAAERLFTALGHKPGRAHVLDCRARVWLESDPERARALWREAVEVYESIEAPHLRDVREGGRSDILTKLARLDARPEQG